MSAAPAQQPTISRRDLIRGRLFGLFGGRSAAPTEAPEQRAEAPSPARRPIPLLRPPGAIAEADFLAACTQCEACQYACPHDAIVPAPVRARGAAGTPVIEPLSQPCMMCPDTPCIDACPSGALLPTDRIRMGTARINPLDCLAGTGCFSCGERCPVPGAITRQGGKPVVSADACTGCGICQWVCPAPHNAVLILPAQDR